MATPLKDQFDRQVVELLAARFAERRDDFDAASFTRDLRHAFPLLELKDRINLLADRLAAELPDDYPTALAIVVDVAVSGVEGFAAWPLCSFVERHGIEYPVESLEAMTTLTKQMSCEFAVRPFLDSSLELTRTHLRRWVADDHEAVRRLASEGTRPRLPWAPRVQALLDDPTIGLELLRALRHDGSETVRRSVANHLNDIAKAHPDLVVEVIREWLDESEPVDEWMVRHALRTLVKQGHPGAHTLLGFAVDPSVEVLRFEAVPSSIALGDNVELTFGLASTANEMQRLVIDFVIHHVNASGATSPKVFKWTTVDLEPMQTVELTKKRLIQTASTRRYHAGHHRVDVLVGGQVAASTGFDLVDSSPATRQREEQ